MTTSIIYKFQSYRLIKLITGDERFQLILLHLLLYVLLASVLTYVQYTAISMSAL